jgi:hypothetical protein
MVDLYQLGAEIVEIPSGQASNSCGDVRSFELTNSKFRGNVSTKSFIAFPDDPEAGELLMPQHPQSTAAPTGSAGSSVIHQALQAWQCF